MLNRYSNAIDSGVPDEDFLKNELSTVRTVFRSQIKQGLEMLKKWGDAYIAMLLSGTVIAVVMMISIAIYAPAGIQGTLNIAYGIILAISVSRNVLMYSSVTDDPKSYGLTTRSSKEQETIRAMERIIVPLTIVAVIVMALFGIAAALIFILIGILMAPLGIIDYIDDTNITLRDADFSTDPPAGEKRYACKKFLCASYPHAYRHDRNICCTLPDHGGPDRFRGENDDPV